jgi:hypothetical protein
MNRQTIILLLTAAMLAIGSRAAAADFYIAQTATGDGSGSSAANCKPYTFFTTASNWNGGTGTICSQVTAATERDTIHLVGTITSQLAWPYPTGTGAAGIRILFEKDAKLSAPTWPNGAIYWESAAYGKHNVIIDGGVNGIIECTANGTNLANHVPSTGIIFISARNVTIQNLTISNLYVRTVPSDDQVDGGNGVYASNAGGPITDFTVRDCTIHDMNIGINAAYVNGCARYSFLRNHIYNINWGIGSGSASSDATMDDWLADGNNIHDFANWDATGEAFHHNGIFLWGSNGTNNFRSWTIRNNTFGPNFGSRATGGVYLSSYGMKGSGLVYNNVFIGSTTNGLLTIGTATGSIVRAYNNTFVGNGGTNINIGGSSASAMTVVLENNISTGGIFINGNYVSSVTLKSNRNLVHSFPTGFPGAISWSTTANGNAVAWTSWQSTYGQDVSSIYNVDPLLDIRLKPKAGSPALGAGSDQSVFFTTYKDSAVSRSVPWSLGACEPVAGGSTPYDLPAPSNTRVIAQ